MISLKKKHFQVASNTPNTSNTDGWENKTEKTVSKTTKWQRERKHPQHDYVTSRRPGQPTLLFLWRKQQSSETCRFNERFQCLSCNKDGHKSYFLFQKQIDRPIGQEIQAKQSCVPKCKLVLKCKGLKGPIPPLKSEIRPGTKE